MFSFQRILRRYRVWYTELYEHIPWLTNSAEGVVTLTQDEGTHQMISDHLTCLLPLDLWCLRSHAIDTFRQHNDQTKMTEVIHVDCPWLLVPLCTSELNTQRSKVLGNIQRTFCDKSK